MKPSPPTVKVRRLLGDYLEGRVDFARFQEEFVRSTWDVANSEDDAGELVSGIDLSIAEFTSGHWTEAELRERLRPMVKAGARS